jgi:membrane fusion protein, heavy metal efflux system
VIPSTNGQAIIQSPQTGKISQLSVKVGERVNKGALLAVITPSLDAGSTVSLLTERNNVEAELQAAKKEYERLKSIEDIAAKRDVAEAEARYQKARENKMLYERLSDGGASSGAIFLRAPISGTVGNFTYAAGSTVNANEAILTITNLSTVYVEAQVFDKDADQVNGGKNFLVECANADEHKTAEVKLLAPAQSINPTNQTQRVIFEMENPDGDFKIGEFVNVRVFAAQASREIALPNSAITEINGRPVVFIKDAAEKYSVSYVTMGQSNGTHTIINKGVEEGERVVTRSTYQMKMIYLNQ